MTQRHLTETDADMIQGRVLCDEIAAMCRCVKNADFRVVQFPRAVR